AAALVHLDCVWRGFGHSPHSRCARPKARDAGGSSPGHTNRRGGSDTAGHGGANSSAGGYSVARTAAAARDQAGVRRGNDSAAQTVAAKIRSREDAAGCRAPGHDVNIDGESVGYI